MSQWWAENQGQRTTNGGGGGAPYGPPATVGRRIGGAIVDGIFVGFVLGLPLFLEAMEAAGEGGTYEPDVGLVLITSVLGLIYGIAPHALIGRTIGKMVAGTQVVRVTDGAVPGWRPAAIRYVVFSLFPLSYLLAFTSGGQYVFFLWDIVLLVTILNDPNKRGLHDKAAGTYVRLV